MSAMMDAISLHNLGGKSIVFVNTKAMCDQVRGGGGQGLGQVRGVGQVLGRGRIKEPILTL